MLPRHNALDLETDEKVLLEVAREVLRGLDLPVHFIFDIGAATGRWSFYVNEVFYDLNKRFHMFEPHPEQFDVLVRAHWDNVNIELNHVAVSDRTGLAPISFADFPEHSSLVGVGERPRIVPVVSLDDYCRVTGVQRISLLKIDVEGAEPHVLRGAANLLHAGRIDCIQMEYGGGWREESLVEVCQWLTEMRFSLFHMDQETGAPDIYAPLDDGEYRNILAVRSTHE